jgi:ribosome-associated toxin RatA of RatAB toxin-antitoxin module
MRKVLRSVEISAEPRRCYETAKNVEEIAKGMEDVERVEVIEREGNRTKTKWQGTLRVASFVKPMEWVEADEWDDGELVCRFWQEEGAFKTYRGKWWFEPKGEGKCVSHIEIEYDIGLPMAGPIIEKLVEKVVVQNIDSMLNSLKRACESQ